jgi:DNA-binding NarL/FixJ family response regulator
LARQESPAGAAAVRQILAEFGRQATGAIPVDEETRHRIPGSAFHLPAEGSRQWQPMIEPLTTRELEILTLLRDPLSAKEIARRLVVQPSTVKRHMANIYRKLDVHTRWAALVKAEALGILPPR